MDNMDNKTPRDAQGADTPAMNERKNAQGDAHDIPVEVPNGGNENEYNRPDMQEGSGFKVSFDFEGEYSDLPDDAPLRVRRTRRSGCIGGAMFIVSIVCVSLLLASLLWLAATDVLGFAKDDIPVVITIPREFTVESVAEILRDEGLIKYEKLFVMFADFSDDFMETVTPGTYELNMNYDYRAIIKSMSVKSGARMTTDITIPEGYTLRQIFNLLDREGICAADDMWEAATKTEFDYEFLADIPKGDRLRLEGFLFPDTYTFYYGDSPTAVLRKMLDNFKVRFKEAWYEQAEDMGYSVREIVIIASMIEREAGAPSDRAKIASVIYNRLNSTEIPRLEIDATINYVIAGTDEAFSTSYDSPYNTYRNNGLPPGAIANPGLAAITAALNPEETDYFFYALSTDEDRHHEFFKTYEEQRAFVESDLYGG